MPIASGTMSQRNYILSDLIITIIFHIVIYILSSCILFLAIHSILQWFIQTILFGITLCRLFFDFIGINVV